MQAFATLDKNTAQAILVEVNQRMSQGGIKNPAGYLLGLIQKAHTGQFKPYWQNKQHQANQAAYTPIKAVTTATETTPHRRLLGATVMESTASHRQHTHAMIANLAKQLRS